MTAPLTFKPKFFDDNGDPLAGGKVYFYEPGTTTPKDTYSNSEGTAANTNPVILDSRGEWSIWGSGYYDVAIYDADDNPIRTEDNIGITNSSIAGETSTTVEFACLGASDSEFGWNEAWVNQLDKAFRTQDIDAKAYQTGAGAITFHLAMTDTDPLTGQTWAAITSAKDPDVIIISLGMNDAILAVGGRTQAQMVVDAQNLYAYFRANNPNAILINGRILPYDHDRHGSVAIPSIKKKFCIPYMHETSTITGDTGLYTSEETEMEKTISTTMQERLTNWRVLDAAVQAEADFTIDMGYFYASRLGWVSCDRVHPTKLGHYFMMSDIWTAGFQENAALRAAVPILQEIRDVGDFTDFRKLWASAVKLDSYGDGYDFDPDFLDGNEFMMQANIEDTTNLIQTFKYWSNIQRPTIGISNTVNKSLDDIFLVSMADLLPDSEIQTKVWLQTDSEPSSWNSDGTLTSPTGSHISALQNATYAAGDYYIKYKIKNDVFGPEPFTVSGSFPTGGSGAPGEATFLRTTNFNTATSDWINVVLNTEEHNDTGGAVSLNTSTGEVTISDTAGYTRFRVTGFATVDSNANGVYDLAWKRASVAQHDRSIGNQVIDSTGGAAWPHLAFPPFWLPITPGGESIFLEVFTPTSTQLQGAYGIGFQVEVK